jgi:uncharacterized membrane protein YkgB
MKQDKGLYLLYLVGVLIVLFVLFVIFNLHTNDIALTGALLILAAHFIAKTLSDPNGVWVAKSLDEGRNRDEDQ